MKTLWIKFTYNFQKLIIMQISSITKFLAINNQFRYFDYIIKYLKLYVGSYYKIFRKLTQIFSCWSWEYEVLLYLSKTRFFSLAEWKLFQSIILRHKLLKRIPKLRNIKKHFFLLLLLIFYYIYIYIPFTIYNIYHLLYC